MKYYERFNSWNVTVEGYFNTLYLMRSRNIQKQCLPLIQNSGLLDSDFASMIISCTGHNKTVYDTNMCYEDGRGELLLPVFSKDGKVYKNRYCAHCNDVYEYQNVPVNMICNSTISKGDIKLGNCVSRLRGNTVGKCKKEKLDSGCPYSNPYF